MKKKIRRRKFREIEVIEVLLIQGIAITCFRCGEPITLEDVRLGNVQKEHLHELVLDGPDVPGNCRFSHKGKPCHHFVTYGNGATTAGSSANRKAKATEPKRIEKFVVNKTPLALPALVDAGEKCRACGNYLDGCTCPPKPERKSAFGSRSFNSAKKTEKRNVQSQ